MNPPAGRITRVIGLFLAAALLTGGCSGRQVETTPAAETQQVSPSPEDEINLEVWLIEGRDTFLPQLIEAYEQEHPHVDLLISEIPEEKYAAQLETSLREGTGPDIAQVIRPEWLAKGSFLQLDAAIQAYRVPFDDFNTGAITRDCLFDGRVYCLGSLTSGTILVYNQDLFDLFGAPYPPADEPLSMQEYHDLIIRLTQKSDRIEERIWGGEAAPYFDWMEPATHVSSDGRVAAGFLDDEPTSVAYQLMANAYLEGAAITEEEAEQVNQPPLELLIAGRQSTALVDSAAAVPVLEQSGIRWGAAIVPTEQKGDPRWSSNRTDGFGVPATSQHPDDAIDFVVFLAVRGSQLRLERGEMPLNMRLAEQWAASSEARGQVFAALRNGRPYPFIPGYAQAMEQVWIAWVQMTEEGIRAKQALDQLTDPVQAVLDLTWAEFEVLLAPVETQQPTQLTPPTEDEVYP